MIVSDLIRAVSDLICPVSDLIWAVIDCPYMLNIEGFGRSAPIPIVGAVYDCSIRTKLILFVSAHVGAVYDRPNQVCGR